MIENPLVLITLVFTGTNRFVTEFQFWDKLLDLAGRYWCTALLISIPGERYQKQGSAWPTRKPYNFQIRTKVNNLQIIWYSFFNPLVPTAPLVARLPL